MSNKEGTGGKVEGAVEGVMSTAELAGEYSQVKKEGAALNLELSAAETKQLIDNFLDKYEGGSREDLVSNLGVALAEMLNIDSGDDKWSAFWNKQWDEEWDNHEGELVSTFKDKKVFAIKEFTDGSGAYADGQSRNKFDKNLDDAILDFLKDEELKKMPAAPEEHE